MNWLKCSKMHWGIGKTVAQWEAAALIETQLPVHSPTTKQAESLPTALLLGDTFAAERYHGAVSRLLVGKARVLLPPKLKQNSAGILANLPRWLEITGKVDLVVRNY